MASVAVVVVFTVVVVVVVAASFVTAKAEGAPMSMLGNEGGGRGVGAGIE